MNQDKTFKILALLFLLIFMLHLSLSIYEGEPRASLWFCATLLILFSIALFYKNTLILSSVVVSSFVIELLWTIDIISFVLTRKLILGLIPYIHEISLLRFIITYYHVTLLIVPVIVVFSLKKFHMYAWTVSSLHLLITFILSIITRAPFNCTNEPCTLGAFTFLYALKPEILPYYLFHWLGLTLIIFIPTNIVFYYIKKSLCFTAP